MTGQLITLPVRLGLRGTRLMFRLAEGAGERALSTSLRVAGTVMAARPGRRAQPSRPPSPPTSPPAESSESRRAASRPAQGNGAGELASRRLEREGFTTTMPASEPAPEHVSEEPELVLESAEPGAADAAGASVRVLEPWEGYERMKARTVISRLASATAAELAAVELYERAHRSRRTVLEAAQRELRTKGRAR